MKLAKWKPMELDRNSAADPFFDRFFELLDERNWGTAAIWSPALEMIEDKGHLLVCFDLPGIDPKSVEVQLTGDRLTLSGERTFEARDQVKYLQREQVYGKFSRTVQLPCSVDDRKGRATYENGVLQIDLPKSEESIGRQIPVEVKSSK
jgi:HSP20 family protein